MIANYGLKTGRVTTHVAVRLLDLNAPLARWSRSLEGVNLNLVLHGKHPRIPKIEEWMFNPDYKKEAQKIET